MNPTLIKSELLVDLHGELPSEIMYFPAGASTLNPSVNGEAKQINVNVSAETAALLQAELETLNKENVRPFIDFDHHGGAAAAIPKRFIWKEGEGVMLELDWTGAGKTAVGGRDYGYFSPTFLLDDKGAVAGIPKSGSIGALVNNPAFRQIKPIHAARAPIGAFATIEGYFNANDQMVYWEKDDLEQSATGAQTGGNNMTTEEEVKALKLDLEAMRAENKKLVEASETKKNDSELATANETIQALREELKTQKIEAATAVADQWIEAAIRDGKLAPKNEEAKAQWKEILVSAGAKGKALLDSIQPNAAFKTVVDVKAGHKDIGKPAPVHDTTGANNDTGKHCDRLVREYMAAHAGVTYDSAWKICARVQPEYFGATN